MPAPPGVGPVAGARWDDLQREGSIGQPCLGTEALLRMANQSPAIAAMGLGQKKLGRLVRAYIASDTDRRDVDEQEVRLLRQLSEGALDSDEARGFLGTIPTVGELVPRAALRELEQQMDGGAR